MLPGVPKDPVLLGVFPYRGLISTEGVPLPASTTLACSVFFSMDTLTHIKMLQVIYF